MTFMLGLESYRDRTRSTVEEPSAPPPTRRRGIEAVQSDFPKLAGHMPPFRHSRRSRHNLTMPSQSRLAQIPSTTSRPRVKRLLRKMARQDGRMLRPPSRKPAA